MQQEIDTLPDSHISANGSTYSVRYFPTVPRAWPSMRPCSCSIGFYNGTGDAWISNITAEGDTFAEAYSIAANSDKCFYNAPHVPEDEMMMGCY